MLIKQPFIRSDATHTQLVSLITDEVTGDTQEIYFSVNNEYGRYLTSEVADAFVVAMLLPALVSGQDIRVEAPVSELLYFQVKNALNYTFSKVFGKNLVHITADKLVTPDFKPEAVATGFSGGVDSFATVLYHTSEECPANLQLTHLTLFNVGAYGNKAEASEAFLNDARRAQIFADEINLPLLLLNSNMCVMHNHPDIYYFSTRCITNIIAGVMALQKLFGLYLISSGTTVDKLKIDPRDRDQGYYDVMLASFLSGPATRIIISGTNLSRMDKLKYISGLSSLPRGDRGVALTHKHLYVCQADVYNEKYGMGFTRDTSPNCCECDKCTRTLMEMELLGILNDFSHRFDLAKWARVRNKRIAFDLSRYKTDIFAREHIDLMHEKQMHLPLSSRLSARKQILREKLAGIRLLQLIYHFIKKQKPQISG